jgi:hypothetical protein
MSPCRRFKSGAWRPGPQDSDNTGLHDKGIEEDMELRRPQTLRDPEMDQQVVWRYCMLCSIFRFDRYSQELKTFFSKHRDSVDQVWAESA